MFCLKSRGSGPGCLTFSEAMGLTPTFERFSAMQKHRFVENASSAA